MMNRKMIITELEKRGYMAKSYDREKNGVILKGIEIVNDSNIVPHFSPCCLSASGF